MSSFPDDTDCVALRVSRARTQIFAGFRRSAVGQSEQHELTALKSFCFVALFKRFISNAANHTLQGDQYYI